MSTSNFAAAVAASFSEGNGLGQRPCLEAVLRHSQQKKDMHACVCVCVEFFSLASVFVASVILFAYMLCVCCFFMAFVLNQHGISVCCFVHIYIYIYI